MRRAHRGCSAKPSVAAAVHAGRAGVVSWTRVGIGGASRRSTARRLVGEARSSGRTAAKYASTSARLAGTSVAPSSSAARTCSARKRSASASESPAPARRTASRNPHTSVTCTQRSRSGSEAR
jgi:hypothetical protein